NSTCVKKLMDGRWRCRCVQRARECAQWRYLSTTDGEREAIQKSREQFAGRYWRRRAFSQHSHGSRCKDLEQHPQITQIAQISDEKRFQARICAICAANMQLLVFFTRFLRRRCWPIPAQG